MAALDAGDLSVKWVFPPNTDEGKRLKLEGIYGAPVFGNDAVYFGAHDGNVYALNAKTGAPLWRFETADPIVGALTVTDGGKLYVGSTDGILYTITVADCTSTCPAGAVETFDTGSSIWGAPLVIDTAVYVPAMNGRLYALNPDTLQPLEGFSFEAAAGLLTDPVEATDGVILVGGIDEKLYALDAATGDQVWDKPLPGSNWFWGSPLVDRDTIYVPGLDGRVYAVDAAGKAAWDPQFKALSPVRASPLLAGDVLVVIDKNGGAYGVDPATGTLKWGGVNAPVLLNKDVLSDPLLLDGEVLVVAQGGDLFRIDPETGAQRSVEVAQ